MLALSVALHAAVAPASRLAEGGWRLLAGQIHHHATATREVIIAELNSIRYSSHPTLSECNLTRRNHETWHVTYRLVLGICGGG